MNYFFKRILTWITAKITLFTYNFRFNFISWNVFGLKECTYLLILILCITFEFNKIKKKINILSEY